MKRLVIEGRVALVDNKGKPLKKVNFIIDHDSQDEVASIDNDMTNFLASKKDGYDDDDMYEGQDISDEIQEICGKFDITVRGHKKK
uniref:Uncharacterized protein n=1 Tax=Tanacetum cinerariifolium TaxID=118510 RepID=A0A699J835_TANCI|nr:hypothetical protein [Tanacetum cinerariifolium]